MPNKLRKADFVLKKSRKFFYFSICLFAVFLAWTAAVCFVDVRSIGPMDSKVGLAAMNGFVHKMTGVNMTLYTVTDWLGILPVCFVFGFAFLGLSQWIKRKKFCAVDKNILALGSFYIAVAAVYVFFEVFVINRRPVLIEGMLEASYPSSTTVLTLCVMSTAAVQFYLRIKNAVLKRIAVSAICAFAVFMVAGRLLSGVHWLNDIIGGILISASLFMMYYSFIFYENEQ